MLWVWPWKVEKKKNQILRQVFAWSLTVKKTWWILLDVTTDIYSKTFKADGKTYSLIFYYFDVFFFFCLYLRHAEVPRLRSNLCHSCNQSHSSDSAGSLACWATGEFRWCSFYWCSVGTFLQGMRELRLFIWLCDEVFIRVIALMWLVIG